MEGGFTDLAIVGEVGGRCDLGRYVAVVMRYCEVQGQPYPFSMQLNGTWPVSVHYLLFIITACLRYGACVETSFCIL